VSHDHHKRILLAREAELSARLEQVVANARDAGDEAVRDIGDESVNDETTAEQFSEAEGDAVVLDQVRDALRRIESGTFGRCVVDGEPIDARRLEAMPWTPYCLKHQQLLEGSGPKTSTL
jgi:RNA polymerase-binding transcription factor